MASERLNELAAIVVIEQTFLRSVAAVLIYREVTRATDPDGELRSLIGQLHKTIDLYGVDRGQPEERPEDGKEIARRNVDAIAAMIPAMRQSGI